MIVKTIIFTTLDKLIEKGRATVPNHQLEMVKQTMGKAFEFSTSPSGDNNTVIALKEMSSIKQFLMTGDPKFIGAGMREAISAIQLAARGNTIVMTGMLIPGDVRTFHTDTPIDELADVFDSTLDTEALWPNNGQGGRYAVVADSIVAIDYVDAPQGGYAIVLKDTGVIVDVVTVEQ